MANLKEFELKVIEHLASKVMPLEQIRKICESQEAVSYEYTGSGYFLTFYDLAFPQERVVCDEPSLLGQADGIDCGFVIFFEDNELTIECHSWGDKNIPEDFRDRNVTVSPLL